MGNSRKSLSPDSAVSSFVERIVSRGEHVVLGLSGGLDSVVLLHVLKALVPASGFSLSCLHVNHKISKNAGNWANFCEDLCGRWHVPIVIEEVDISPHLASGLEAAARAARYAAFDRVDADHVFLAQHRDDQAETVLLQLARGAGLRGLAAMGESMAYGGKFMRRPFLSISRSALEAYARENNLEWVNDESNADLRFDRNFVRNRLIPLMEERFPAARETVSRAAGHIAEAAGLLDELADMDGSGTTGCLEVSRLFSLSEARAKNLLRRHLSLCGVRMPSSERLREMLKQLRSESACVAHDGFEVRSYRGLVHVVRPLHVASDFSRIWTGESRMPLDELGGVLVFEEGAGGVDPGKLREPVTVRVRRGGEKFVVQENRPTRSLKNLFQEHGVPPWERNRLPLLYCGETLVWIPGIGIDPRYRSERGLLPGWESL